MLSAVTAAHIIAGKIPKDFAVAAVYTANPAAVSALGYSSETDAASGLMRAIDEYVAAAPDQWPQIPYAAIRPDKLPDEALGARLILGCAQFGTAAASMITTLTQSRQS